MSKKYSPAEMQERLWKEIGSHGFAFTGLVQAPGHDVPMTLHRDGDNEHSLWIFTTRDGPIAAGGQAVARFVSKGQDFFSRLNGTLVTEHDTNRIDRLWSRQIEAWFPGGRDDPNLLVQRFDLSDVEIWIAELSALSLIKLMVGANVHDDVQGQHGRIAVG